MSPRPEVSPWPSEQLRDGLRGTFDGQAERYARARPGYPDAVFDALDEVLPLAGCRVLEIGPGAGQATRALATRGAAILGVELGPELARVARRELAAFPDVSIELGAFESWDLPSDPFDLVFAATAFHWVDPEVRVEKSARALRPGGWLATLATHHVAGGDERFFVDVQTCYERFDPDTPAGLRLPTPEQLPSDAAEIESSPHFDPPRYRRLEREIRYTTRTYLDLLLTYSGMLALPEDARRPLLECIARLIDTRYAGAITKRYLFELRLARRR